MYNILYFYKLLSKNEITDGIGRYIALYRMMMTYSSYHFWVIFNKTTQALSTLLYKILSQKIENMIVLSNGFISARMNTARQVYWLVSSVGFPLYLSILKILYRCLLPILVFTKNRFCPWRYLGYRIQECVCLCLYIDNDKIEMAYTFPYIN